jgi:periplasmic divalent cation tolerance protein
MSQVVVVLTTVADDEHAERLARQLVDERMAACVNLYPSMVSIYRWKGQVARDGERQMVIKTTRDRLHMLEARLKELHPYELPEFLVLSVDGSSDAYATWVDQETRGS